MTSLDFTSEDSEDSNEEMMEEEEDDDSSEGDSDRSVDFHLSFRTTDGDFQLFPI